jgi:hypothetical protein
VRADFNRLFGDLLSVSLTDHCVDEKGNDVRMMAGMRATAYDEDVDEHDAIDDRIATGVVEKSSAMVGW